MNKLESFLDCSKLICLLYLPIDNQSSKIKRQRPFSGIPKNIRTLSASSNRGVFISKYN